MSASQTVLTIGSITQVDVENSPQHTLDAAFDPFGPSFTHGFSLSQLSTGTIAVGTRTGVANEVALFSASGTPIAAWQPFTSSFTGGASVTWLGPNDLVVGAGPGGGPLVELYNLNTITQPMLASSFFAFAPSYTGGITVAGIDAADIAVGTLGGVPATVAIFAVNSATLINEFDPFGPSFTGSLSLAGLPNGMLAVGAGAGAEPEVNIYDSSQHLIASFFAFSQGFTGGVKVAWLDATHLAVGAGPGGGPEVNVYDLTNPADPTLVDEFFAFNSNYTGGVTLASVSDVVPPTVTAIAASTRSASTQADLGQTITIRLTTSEAVTETGGSPFLTLSNGATADYVAAASDATHLAFQWTVTPGHDTGDLELNSFALNGGSVTDLFGNALVMPSLPTDLDLSVDGSPSSVPGSLDEWILSGGQWIDSVGPGSHPAGYNIAGTGDWTGGGTDGILWFNPTTGDVDEWQLANAQWSNSVDLSSHPGNYQISGVGDFNHDGTSDVLWTSASSGGVQTDIWKLGSDGKWAGSVTPGSHPAGYTVAGIGDWTGNGTDGILWFNPTTLDVDEWQLSNGKWSASVDLAVHPDNPDGNDAQIAGVGDFFDNGRDGVLWTSVNADGTIATDIWELDSTGHWMASVSPGNHPAGYTVAGVGDFTGTGTSDILWYNASTGDVDEWLINNGHWAGSVDLGPHPGNFQIAGVGDFTNSGTKDVLWHAPS